MGELANCPKCDAIFVKSAFRDVCDPCFKEEEKLFEKVYNFIRKKENRTATMNQVVEGTEVDEVLIVKFIKTGRLKLAHFPNLGYSCEKCGTTIRDGKICGACAVQLKSQLSSFEKEEQRKKEINERSKVTYYTRDR
ncbi:TIGR03826 family flagellar region protein [Peribacillus alkalitolerans]|uniref:TIGR03826 family flagellar region protein n=1 Tax=Peribacillus alkalitolerans TaxID=1550385 RepID=UPI0013D30995|nr:TIGR03826 family flagellar region protein [Peribacillus alkalitolerans]